MTQLPLHIDPSEVDVPPNWRLIRISDAYEQLPAGKRYDTKTVSSAGRVPVINQSLDGLLGYHDDPPGVEASFSDPVVTFANHTCAMRVMRQPFSSIQNVFPMRGRAGVCDTLYLYYSTNNRQGIEDYKGHHPVWRNSFIALPNLKTQKAIVQVLAALDDLIENNLRRVQVLEEMARAIYREWFVKFRYPGHEQVPLVDSAFGPIPKGWKVEAASTAVQINPTIKFDRAVEHPFIAMGDVSETSMVCYPSGTRTGGSGARFEDGDTLLARIHPSLQNGKTGFVQSLGEGIVGLGSTEFIVMRGRSIGQAFTYCLARQDEFRSNAIASMVGASGRQRVRNECFDNYYLAVPPATLIHHFEAIAAPLFADIDLLHRQAKSLSDTRDLLLPKLVTGQIDVSSLNLDRVLEEAVA